MTFRPSEACANAYEIMTAGMAAQAQAQKRRQQRQRSACAAQADCPIAAMTCPEMLRVCAKSGIHATTKMRKAELQALLHAHSGLCTVAKRKEPAVVDPVGAARKRRRKAAAAAARECAAFGVLRGAFPTVELHPDLTAKPAAWIHASGLAFARDNESDGAFTVVGTRNGIGLNLGDVSLCKELNVPYVGFDVEKPFSVASAARAAQQVLAADAGLLDTIEYLNALVL